MQVKLTIPDHVWGKLAVHADANQVKVADLITDAITGIIAPAAETQKTVADLVTEGYPRCRQCARKREQNRKRVA